MITKSELLTIKGNKQLNPQNKYAINEDNIIELKGEFHSEGKEKSRIYFGLRCFRENGEEIFAPHINRQKEDLLIISINTNEKSFTLDKKPETWHNKTDNYSNRVYKYIGIYYDGNINRLPDYLLKTPAYNTYGDNIIHLNNEIPRDIMDKIILFKTRVMNHFSSGTYDYSAACSSLVPEQWKEYKALYSGFSDGYGDISGKFRLNTKIVSPHVRCNYDQNEDCVLEIRNIEMNIKEKPKFI